MQYVNLHILTVLPFSNANRDDDGAPKQVTFGGAPRARISSQSKKRHARIAYETSFAGDRTVRSTRLAAQAAEYAAEALTAAGVHVDDSAAEALAKQAKKVVGKLTSGKEDAKDTIAWLAEDELRQIGQQVAEAHTAGEDTPDLTLPQTTGALSIAMFGRMFANKPDFNVEAAVQVGHGFTTHEAVIEIDYFTAVDDIVPDDGSKGAGYLSIAQFTSGVYYTSISIDKAQLHRTWTGMDESDAVARLTEAVRQLIVALPTGKQNATNHQSRPAFVLAVDAAAPLTFAGAFEAPVQAAEDGYLTKSIERLRTHANQAATFDPDTFSGMRSVSLSDATAESNLRTLCGDVARSISEYQPAR